MTSTALRLLCRLLILALFLAPLRPAMAGMIATDQALAGAAAQADRDVVNQALMRGDVARGLQAQGVDPEAVKARVAAMTDAEAHALADRIGTAPAGGHVSGWVIAVVVALAIWAFYAYR